MINISNILNLDPMRNFNPKKLLGMILGVTALPLAFYFYGWELSLIIVLALWGNNLERNLD